MRSFALIPGLVAVNLARPSNPEGSSLGIVQQPQAESSKLARSRLEAVSRRQEDYDYGSPSPTDPMMEALIGETEAKELSKPESSSSLPTNSSLPATSALVSQPSNHGEEHEHSHSRESPKLILDEADILRTHSPDPPSYYDFDQAKGGMPGTMIAHVVLMSIGLFGFLPLSIFLKAGGSSLSIFPQVTFVVFALLGLLCGQLYRCSTPSLYEGSSHSSLGWLTVVFAIALALVDIARSLLRSARFGGPLRSLYVYAKSKIAIHDGRTSLATTEEEIALVESPSQEYPPSRWSSDQPRSSISPASHGSSQTFSDSDTIYDSAGPDNLGLSRRDTHSTSTTIARRVVWRLVDLVTRLLVVLAYVEIYTGVMVYAGLCRGNYLNGCLAHGIKGSIFFWYGLLTFARYCGGMSQLGWAWNRRPGAGERSIWTAEFVESFVIFLYGSTNTWLERLGKTGAYSVKDVQHISIAIMFWGAGGLGMLLESRTVRSWLASSAIMASSQDPSRIVEPASASFSFNPFPALVIGVTGLAMSAHHQTYQFQVEIHASWGYLLSLFSLSRFLTYFFLYLRPPASILPSRPPTEALASMFLTCGGIVFILSTEQITFAAMRHDADDMMAFLNVTFAFVCVVFFWLALLFGIKGWAVKRNASRLSSQDPLVKSA
ncbi:hypothetical protein JCM16303_002987 [Sporobolomyces ruberrimus]